MRPFCLPLCSSLVRGSAAGLMLAFALGGSSLAQTASEVTVTAHMGPANTPQALSYPVSYADLNLKNDHARMELDRRIKVTVDYLCEKLGETKSPLIPSCEAAAMREVKAPVEAVKQRAMASNAHWHPGPAWKPPPGRK